jgi:hypothetical protein
MPFDMSKYAASVGPTPDYRMERTLSFNGFDAEEFWRDKQHKKYVVHLNRDQGRKTFSDTLLIQARNPERAFLCAKRHSLLKGRVYGRVRLARPEDLGARSTEG